MKSGLLQASIEDRRLVLDPRTKLFMLITMAIFVLGGTASDVMPFAAPVLCAMPVCYLFIDRQYYTLTTYVILYSSLYFINGWIVPGLTGNAHYILYILTVFIIRFLKYSFIHLLYFFRRNSAAIIRYLYFYKIILSLHTHL